MMLWMKYMPYSGGAVNLFACRIPLSVRKFSQTGGICTGLAVISVARVRCLENAYVTMGPNEGTGLPRWQTAGLS